MVINPYLNFPGTSEEAFTFYKSIFGGEFSSLHRFKDTPHGDQLSADEAEKVMHISLPVGANILMATDALPSMGFNVTTGNNSYIAITPDSRDEATRIFRALAEGGNVEMDIQDMFWGDYYGSLADKFGIRWMVNYPSSAR